MQYLQKHTLHISNPKKSLDFYISILGMKLIDKFIKDSKVYHYLKFNDDTDEAILELIFDKYNDKTLFPKDSSKFEGYWKMAISIKDVDIAREKLLEKGVEVTPAFQVPNVAYLCHFLDPDGYALELIQHKFESNHIKQNKDTNYALGNKAVFSLITYRVKDINKSLEFYTKNLGMKLLSKMDVSARGFELYFLGYTNQNITNKDILSIENREWLWQREFTIVELQYIFEKSVDDEFRYEVGLSTGFDSITIKDTNITQSMIFNDPDNYTIKIEK